MQNDDLAGEDATCSMPKVSWAGIDDILVMLKVCLGAEKSFLAVPKVPWVAEDGFGTVRKVRGGSRHGFGAVPKVWGRRETRGAGRLPALPVAGAALTVYAKPR